MSLITNNISGSSSGNWRIGMTGSVVISDRPTVATFPLLPGDASLFIDGTKRTVVKGDSTFSGSIVASGSTILVGAVSLAGNSQTVTHTGTGDLTLSSTGGNVIVEGTIFNTNDVGVAGDLSVNGGDVFTSAPAFNLINTSATPIRIGAVSPGIEIGSTTSWVSTKGTHTVSGSLIVSGSSFQVGNVTLTGDLAVNGGDVTTTTGTATVFNTNATSVNIGGAATTLKMGAPGVTLNIGNVLTGTTSLVTVKGDLQIDGNNIKSTGGTYTPITLSSTTNNTTLNGNLYVGDGSAGSGGGDIVLQPSLSPVNSADITTTSTTANLFSADASGGLGTATVNVGKSGGTNKVVVGNILKLGGNKVVSSGDYEAITLSSTSKHTTLNGYLYVGDSTANGGDIYMSPGPGEAADIVTDSSTGNVFSSGTSLPTTVKIGSGATTAMEVGPATGKATKIMGDLQVAGNRISGSAGVTALTLSNANVYVSGNLYVGETTAPGSGDIIMRPLTGQAADLSTTSTTANVFNSATTVRLGNTSATTVDIGAASSMTRAFGKLQALEQPAFLAYSNAEQLIPLSTTNLTASFGTEIFDTNLNFNSSTSIFTAPVGAKYLFCAGIKINNVQVTASYYQVDLLTSNKKLRIAISAPLYVTSPTAGTYMTLNGSVIADMDASDTACVLVTQNGGLSKANTEISQLATFFSGYMLPSAG